MSFPIITRAYFCISACTSNLIFVDICRKILTLTNFDLLRQHLHWTVFYVTLTNIFTKHFINSQLLSLKISENNEKSIFMPSLPKKSKKTAFYLHWTPFYVLLAKIYDFFWNEGFDDNT